MIFGLLLELPYDYFILDDLQWLPLGINAIFPPLLMAAIGLCIRTPKKDNTDKIIEEVDNIVYSQQGKEHRLKITKPKGGFLYYLMQTIPFYFFELETATHYTYVSDLMYAEPYLANFDPYGGVPIIGIDNERAVNIINTYVAAFFNKHLKNTEEPLLEEPSCDYPEVCFRNQPLTIPPCSWLYSSSFHVLPSKLNTLGITTAFIPLRTNSSSLAI